MDPFLALFKQTDMLIDSCVQQPNHAAQLTELLTAISLLFKMFESLICQDLPEFIEDHSDEFMSLMMKFLIFKTNALGEDSDLLEKIKTSICEILVIYATRYESDFPRLAVFVETVWNLLISTNMDQKNDLLVSKAISFLTSVTKHERHKDLFSNPETLSQICEKIVLPNMSLRESDEEQFEDDFMGYIRRDLEGSESDSRRRSASDLVRGLVEHFAKQVTEIFGNYVQQYLGEYSKNPKEAWKAKDTALYLIISLCAKGVLSQSGAVAVNEFVPLLEIFSGHILTDLQAPVDGAIHPIIKVDCIKYVMMFRSQLPNIASLVPILINHLGSASPAVYTYASICLEKIFTSKVNDKFGQKDVAVVGQKITQMHFQILARAGSVPQKMAENEYLFKTIMRTVVLCREDVIPFAEEILNNTGLVLKIICENPSNPKFNHFVFETVAALVRFIPGKDVSFLPQFEAILHPQFHLILIKEISEFTPYVLQLMSQLLNLHPEPSIPQSYMDVLPPLLQPIPWENHGNIPALVSLMEAYVKKGSYQLSDQKHLSPFFGICQKLVTSRVNDIFGFELLRVIFESMPRSSLEPFLKPFFLLLVNRLSGPSKTSKFVKGFLGFICASGIAGKQGLGFDGVIGIFDSIQPGLFFNILKSVFIPELAELHTTFEKKLIGFGLLVLLSTDQMLRDPMVQLWPSISQGLKSIIKTFAKSITTAQQTEQEMQLLEESGYQAGFSKLSVIGGKEDAVVDEFKFSGVEVGKMYGGTGLQCMFEEVVTRLRARDEGVWRGVMAVVESS